MYNTNVPLHLVINYISSSQLATYLIPFKATPSACVAPFPSLPSSGRTPTPPSSLFARNKGDSRCDSKPHLGTHNFTIRFFRGIPCNSIIQGLAAAISRSLTHRHVFLQLLRTWKHLKKTSQIVCFKFVLQTSVRWRGSKAHKTTIAWRYFDFLKPILQENPAWNPTAGIQHSNNPGPLTSSRHSTVRW